MVKDIKLGMEELKLEIDSFIKVSKDANEKYRKESKEIEKKYNIEIDSEVEYYTAKIKSISTIDTEETGKFDVEWECEFSSDWNGEDPNIDEYEVLTKDIPFDLDVYDDELMELIDEKINEFASEYGSVFEDYYSTIEKFWVDNGFSVDFDELSMTLTGYGYRISTTNWNHESQDDFDIEVEEE